MAPFERLGEVLALVGVDDEGVVRSVSPAAEALFGLTGAQTLGRPIWLSFHAESSASESRAAIDRIAVSGRALPARHAVVRRCDGSTIPVLLSVLPDPEGRGAHFLHVPLDVLERGVSRRLAALEEMPAGLFVLDAEGFVPTSNGRADELLGREKGGLEGASLARTGALPEALVARLARLGEGEGGGSLEESVEVMSEGGERRGLRVVAKGAASGGAVVLLLPDPASRRPPAAGRDEAPDGPWPALRLLPKEGDSGPGSGRPRVLVVDDTDDNREFFAHVLRSRGADVTTAATGEEALAAAGTAGFDLAFVDLQMPGMDGFALLERLRAIPGAGSRPVVALTALTSDVDRERCRTEGFDAWVAKPVTVRRLGELLERFAPKRGA